MIHEIQLLRQQGTYTVKGCKISRAFEDEVCVSLECGYKQRFFTVEKSDEELIANCRAMKAYGIASSTDFF